MKVGIIGSGGREHVICYSLKKSNKIDEIFCFPGNAGTSSIAKNVNIDLQDFNKFKDFIKFFESICGLSFLISKDSNPIC